MAENNLNAAVNLDLVTVFRAYDVRGVYGTDLTEELTRRVGESFGSYAGGGRVSLGRDTRISGPSLQKAFLNGVLSTGCEVQSFGIIPIAILSYITWADRLKAAAYISASHNPPEYNGVRFRTCDGYGLLYQESSIMRFYREGGFLSGSGREIARSPDEAIERYRQYVARKLKISRSLKIVLDMGNGSACTMNSFYERLGFDSIVMNGTMDGCFPGRGPAPNERSLAPACKVVVDSGADFGVGFDPDADRGIIIDDKGRVLPPEKVAIIIARRRYKSGDLVISGFDCSMIMERELEKDGIKVLREKVGDVFVANRVKNEGAVLGVERSGHFFLPEFQYSDDPFAMSLAIGEIISEGEKLSALADQIPDYPYRQISIRLSEDPADVMRRLKEALARQEPDTTDGLKITTESHSVLIRPSNTEPILRLYIEDAGRDMKELEERYLQIIHEAMRKAI
ncbi:MAG: putative phosphoglucosamine mutase [Methanosaeta sp. PtaB.Bin018]|nr:MAG: putative phosphoglucosamine mutase [Methanosaeta sp. PtaB.Bin018]